MEAVIKSGGRGHSRLAEDLLLRTIRLNGEGEWKGKKVGKGRRGGGVTGTGKKSRDNLTFQPGTRTFAGVMTAILRDVDRGGREEEKERKMKTIRPRR